jgi:hypothetical protein
LPPDLNGGVNFPGGHWTTSFPLQPVGLRICHMEASAGFGTSQLFLTDSRLALAVLNHLRYQALNHMFGMSREQANVLTAVLLLGAADGAYETGRRITGMRFRVSGPDAALGAFALRGAALDVAGPGGREIPGFGALVAFAMLGGLAAPGLRRTAQRIRAAEQRLRAAEERMRSERIRRYLAAQGRGRASAA